MEGIYHPTVGSVLQKSEYEALIAHDLDSGTSFPVTPTEKDLFYRTDLSKLYFYDGTGWVPAGSLRFESFVDASLAQSASYTPASAGLYYVVTSTTLNSSNFLIQYYSDAKAGGTWVGVENLSNALIAVVPSDGTNMRLYKISADTGYFRMWRGY